MGYLKPKVEIRYKNLQSKAGEFIIYDDEGKITETGKFTFLEVSQSHLIFYVSDNSLTEKGRIGKIISLAEYTTEFI